MNGWSEYQLLYSNKLKKHLQEKKGILTLSNNSRNLGGALKDS